jgi:hypothetical protein
MGKGSDFCEAFSTAQQFWSRLGPSSQLGTPEVLCQYKRVRGYTANTRRGRTITVKITKDIGYMIRVSI